MITVLKPGLLVSLHSTVRGGVEYMKRELDADQLDADGARVARWETTRRIPDPAEFERAGAARGKARATVAGVCCASAFGLLCPSEKEYDLRRAVTIAREIADEHNKTATLTRVEVFVLIGRVAQDDAEAARAISAEVRQLLDDMQAGIKAADPSAIREAANKARALGGMLTDTVSGKVESAIVEARRAARELTRRVEKAGEQAAAVVAVCSVRAVESARFAFLDMDERQATPEAPAARGLDLPAAAELDDAPTPTVPEPTAPAAVRAAPLSLSFELEL